MLSFTSRAITGQCSVSYFKSCLALRPDELPGLGTFSAERPLFLNVTYFSPDTRYRTYSLERRARLAGI